MKKYYIMYEGRKGNQMYEGMPSIKGDYVIFKNLTGGKDFKLNKVFFKGHQIENDVIFIK